VVIQSQWEKARVDFMAREKEFTKARDELNRARRLPAQHVLSTERRPVLLRHH
jgi:predicted dithiol-disulfide oxidoreductase (DUF899 family)